MRKAAVTGHRHLMPMIDVYAATGTFADEHQLAVDLVSAVMIPTPNWSSWPGRSSPPGGRQPAAETRKVFACRITGGGYRHWSGGEVDRGEVVVGVPAGGGFPPAREQRAGEGEGG